MITYRHNLGELGESGSKTAPVGRWLSLLLVCATLLMTARVEAQSGDGKGLLYGLASNGDLVWHQHLGRQDGSFTWAYGNNGEGNRVVGTGWDAFSQLFSGGDGIMYAVSANGDLNWYRHEGRWYGTFDWFQQSPAVVGFGWDAYTHLFSGGDEIIYGVLPNGDLMWHRHEGRTDGSFRWTADSENVTSKLVGYGWGSFIHLFAGANGVIYGVTSQGELKWYRHDGRADGAFVWAAGSGNTVGTGWNAYEQLFAGSDGVIYGVLANGDLVWHRHEGRNDGSFRWSSVEGQTNRVVGTGWNAYHGLFSGDESYP